MNHIYKVPIIPQNLSKQETIIQVAEVLNHLSNVTEDIFKHINNKVESSNKKLLGITKRIANVNSNITKLSGAKKATQVFSSCKYPASEKNEPYVSIFCDVKPPEIVRHKVKHKKTVTSDEPVDKLHVYHVKVKRNDNHKESINGLGVIPNDIDCVNDLLLYNSGKNLYTNFVISDALNVSQQIREQDSNDSSSIGAAPHSISERSTLTRSSTQNYFYNPNLGELPALDVPLDLPDLPNIADDLRYDTELGPGIAPSVTTTPNIPDLPVIEYIIPEVPIEIVPQVELPPPPPPPPAITIPEPPQLKIIEVVKIPEDIESKTPEVADRRENEVHKLSEVPQLDIHASLMDAIRKAGGSKTLKSREPAARKESAKSTLGGGDLMADLHAKLSMRRKGISGAKKQEGLDAGSAMEKISAMIPPPVKTNKELNENTEDEDWDD